MELECRMKFKFKVRTRKIRWKFTYKMKKIHIYTLETSLNSFHINVTHKLYIITSFIKTR